jgi:hypothetical protein
VNRKRPSSNRAPAGAWDFWIDRGGAFINVIGRDLAIALLDWKAREDEWRR